MLGKIRFEPFVKNVYTTNDPKDISDTLVEADLKMA